jgi:hypothetical protein
MRVATSLSILLLAAACNRQQPPPPSQNLAANAPMDIETLPPDESDATPTNQLESGVDKPDVNDVATNGN